IGLDTSHVVAFTNLFNKPDNKGDLAGIRVVAAYPGGSPDIPDSKNRLAMFTDTLKNKYGVEIVDSIDELLKKVDVVLLEMRDGRTGTFRGIRAGGGGYGGLLFGTSGVTPLTPGGSYEPLVVEIAKFFRSGKPPVSAEETTRIFAFMEAADESKRQNGASVTLESVLVKARAKSPAGKN